MISTVKLAELMERDEEMKCFGIFDGVPYFIDMSACPFAKQTIYRYNPLNDYGTDILFVTDKDLPPVIKTAALGAMRKRDTECKEYIEDLHSFGEKTLTEEYDERKEKAARKSRTA